MSDENPTDPQPVSGRDAVREKAQQVKARQSRARVARISALSLGALALAAGVVTVVAWTLHTNPTPPTVSPANLTNDGVEIEASAVSSLTNVANGTFSLKSDTPDDDASAPADEKPEGEKAGDEKSATPVEGTAIVDVRVYLDYHSEGAAVFQLANAKQLSEWVREGAITLSYHPIALHTAKSNGTKYSLRAAAAATCVAVEAPDSFFAYNHELLAKQPPQDNDGMTDDELASLAAAVGAENPGDIRDCIDERTYVSWARSATERALANPLPDTDGITLTDSPTILVNGKPYVGKLSDPAEFSQFVLTASSDAYYKSVATQTPSPTVTSSPSATPEKSDDKK